MLHPGQIANRSMCTTRDVYSTLHNGLRTVSCHSNRGIAIYLQFVIRGPDTTVIVNDSVGLFFQWVGLRFPPDVHSTLLLANRKWSSVAFCCSRLRAHDLAAWQRRAGS